MQYRQINRLTGWLIFVVATTVYTLTVEPTVSLWDCGEFIAAAYKLQVPHPPGAPLFLLLGRLFSFLAMGNTERVAFWINMISVLSSGATVMLLYWTITLLGKKVLKVVHGQETKVQTIWLVSSGVVGALAYTFSDSFWFSATEAEVYGLSSFFMALVFWAMLAWEHIDSPARANRSAASRWLIFIAYMMGLSIGVHLLNLVTIPALALIYYFRWADRTMTSRRVTNTPEYKVNVKISARLKRVITKQATNAPEYKGITIRGIIITLMISLGLIGLTMVGIIPGLPSVAGSLEVFFVNSLGMPFGSGLIFFVVLLLGSLGYGLYYSIKHQKVLLNTGLLALIFILIGYASYALVLIRSNYNPPIDENNPETIISFVSYLKRDQYGSRPLLYGPYFSAKLTDQQEGAPMYEKGKDRYILTNHKLENIYDPKQSTLFPRAYSTQDNHAELYRRWMGLGPNENPDFGDNLSFFFRYQLGHMYLRYFMWNFAGRESDIRDAGWLLPWQGRDVPEALASNKACNNYLMLPLLLGLLGLFFQYKKDVKGFSVVAMLFVLTGIALVIYLNSPPVEPRERDYIYVGSYYAFAIWIGLGVMAVAQFATQLLKNRQHAGMAAAFICLSVPVLMAEQGWDDHDRTGRYFAEDMAKNVLSSCAPNAILFTGGDNDTFPLWYAQEVEGFRTDVRVIVLSYFNTDWYINQMKRPAYDSDPLPLSLTEENYKQGGANDYLPYVERPGIKGAISLEQFLKLIRDDSPALQLPDAHIKYNTVPAETFYLDIKTHSPTEKQDVMASTGMNENPGIPTSLQEIIPENMHNLYTNRLYIHLKSNGLEKKDLMMLDLLATNQWERPVYFNTTSLMGTNLDFSANVVQEGAAYRLLPVTNPNPVDVLVNSPAMYDNMMHKFSWRALDDPEVYYTTEDHIYRGISTYRQYFNTLIGTLLEEGKTEKARKALLECLKVMPDSVVAYDFNTVEIVGFLWTLQEKEKALALSSKLQGEAKKLLDYYLKEGDVNNIEVTRNLVLLQSLAKILQQHNAQNADTVMRDFVRYYQLVQ